jgi:hypothetical protein
VPEPFTPANFKRRYRKYESFGSWGALPFTSYANGYGYTGDVYNPYVYRLPSWGTGVRLRFRGFSGIGRRRMVMR